MEAVKYALVPIVWAVSTISVGVCLLSLIIKKIRGKEVSKVIRNFLVSVTISVIMFAIMLSYVPTEEEKQESMAGNVRAAQSVETATESEAKMPTQTANNAMGETKDYPFVLTAEALADEINQDIDAAKAKYNDKWVKITGTISDTSDGGIMYGYYLYGQKSTSGYRGLRIMCWCEDGPYSGSVLGDTQTFLGLLREITTVNVTEIADCEIVNK